MGYAYAMSGCICCSALFSYNPMRVPSVRINGKREPVCQSCVAIANSQRILNGLPPIVPFADAYEPIDEHCLSDFNE